jgi:hypothetical protein
MSSITVRFHKDLELASGMVSEDYLAKHIRKRPLYSNIPSRPPLPESPFVSCGLIFHVLEYVTGFTIVLQCLQASVNTKARFSPEKPDLLMYVCV